MGTAALVLGIIGVVLAVLFFPLGILLGVVAAVLGYLGRKKAARREATNRGQATAGLVLGLVAILVGGIIAAVLGNFLAENSDEISNLASAWRTPAPTKSGPTAPRSSRARSEAEVVVVGAGGPPTTAHLTCRSAGRVEGQSSRRRAETNASCGTSTRPMFFIFFLPSFCFSRSLRLRVMSPP
jgi:amino acid transporter